MPIIPYCIGIVEILSIIWRDRRPTVTLVHCSAQHFEDQNDENSDHVDQGQPVKGHARGIAHHEIVHFEEGQLDQVTEQHQPGKGDQQTKPTRGKRSG
jgi:hypothetical protein